LSPLSRAASCQVAPGRPRPCLVIPRRSTSTRRYRTRGSVPAEASHVEVEVLLVAQDRSHLVGVVAEEVDQAPVGAEGGALGDGLLDRCGELVGLEVLMVLGGFRDLERGDDPAPR